MRILLASLALSLSLPAAAAEDLVWQWEEGQHRRYFLQAGIKFQANFPMGAEVRYDFMAQDVLLSLIADCEATEVKKKRTLITCTLEDVGLLAGVGNATASDVVGKVVAEYKEKLTGAMYHTSITPGGRLGPGELDGVVYRSQNQRTNKITAGMEALLDRAFAGLDVGLPKPGTAWEDGWVAKSQMSMFIPTTSGGNGMNKVKFTVDAAEATHVDATTEGNGTIMEGIDVVKAYEMESTGLMRFDHNSGHVVAHVYQTTGRLTASSVSLPGRSGDQQRSSAGAASMGAQGSRDLGPVGMATRGDSQASFLQGGAYDPDVYLEAGRIYILGEGEAADVGPSGPLLYPTAEELGGASQE